MSITDVSQMNEKINFYTIESVKNPESGVAKPTKVIQLKNVWCAINGRYLKDILASIGTASEDQIIFVIRERKEEIKSDWIIEYESNDYKITKITPDVKDKRFMIIIAKRK